jgi:hypothetical protein
MRDGDHVTVVHSYSRAEAGAAFDAQMQKMKDTVAALLKENEVCCGVLVLLLLLLVVVVVVVVVVAVVAVAVSGECVWGG